MTRAIRRAAGVVLAVIAAAVLSGGVASGRGAHQAAADAPPASPNLLVVLRDHSPPSQRARFEVSRAVALRDDGPAVDLRIAPARVAGGGAPEEVLWLEGAVPPGAYSGLEISFASAATGESGRELPLEVAKEPARVRASFVIGAGAGTVLEVALISSRAAESPGRFAPVLEGRPRPRPTPGLLGLASVDAWSGVALFDKRTGALVSVLPVGRGPAGLAIDPERLRAYVAVSGDDTIAVLDLLEGRVREQVSLRAGDAPRDVALSTDGHTLVVANAGSDTVSFVDPIAAIEIERVPVQGRPASLLMDRGGQRVFVLAERSSAIAVLSVSSRAPVGAIAVEAGPVRAHLSGRNGERIVVAHADSPYLSVVDSGTLVVAQRVYVGAGARALEVDPRSGRIFLARGRTGRIEVFDPQSFLPVEEIPVPGEVLWLAVESEGNALGVLLREPAEVRLIGLVGSGTVTRTPLGGGPAALRFVQGGNAP